MLSFILSKFLRARPSKIFVLSTILFGKFICLQKILYCVALLCEMMYKFCTTIHNVPLFKFYKFGLKSTDKSISENNFCCKAFIS